MDMKLLDTPASKSQDQKNLLAIFNAALAAVDPCHAVLNAVKAESDFLYVADTKYDLQSFDRIVVVGAGKATARMALAVESLLGEKIAAGLIVVKDGHTAALSIIGQAESTHPVPGETGVVATARILDMARAATTPVSPGTG